MFLNGLFGVGSAVARGRHVQKHQSRGIRYREARE